MDATNTSAARDNEPRYRTRVNVTKNTKGYQYETTAEVEWHGALDIGPELLAMLMRQVDERARSEIMTREALDDGSA